MRLRHVTFMVRDIERSIEFYETMTDLKVSRRFTAGPAELAFLTNGAGETEIELVQRPEGAKYTGKGMFLCFQTDELEKRHELAEQKGLKPSAIQDPGDGTAYFYTYDPDGVSVQLRVFPD